MSENHSKESYLKQKPILEKKRRLLDDFKIRYGCERCGYNKCSRALCFHHLDPETKSRRVKDSSDSEIEKCILLCANCHAELHSNK